MHPERILVIDDEVSIRDFLLDFLQEKGFIVKGCGSAEEGLSLLEEEPAVALVDLVLPGMDGLHLMAEIKRRCPDTEIIMMTSHASLESAVEAIRGGAYDYLRKPFEDLEAVWLTVRRAIERRAMTIHNRNLLNDLGDRNQALSAAVRRLTSLNEAGRAMSTMRTLSELLDFFVGLVVEELEVDRASLMLVDDPGGDLRIAAFRGIQSDVVESVRVKLGEGIAGQVAQSGKPILVKDVKSDPRVKSFKPHLADSFISSPIMVSIPIKLQEKVLGVINVTNKRSGEPFGDADMDFLFGLAGQAAVAIEATARFEALQGAYESLKSTQAQLVASERLKALGQMAAGVAHDFNNILNGLLGRTQLLLQRLDGKRLQIRHFRSELDLMEQICLDGADAVKRVQDFTGIRRDPPTETVDLNAVLRDVVAMTQPKWRDESRANGGAIEIQTALGNIPSTLGNPHDLHRLFSNLIFNAVEAMPAGGTLSLSTRLEGDRIVVTMVDTGVGMTPEVQARISEPFFTTKGEGRGLGLGIVRGILSRFEGELTVDSRPGSGTTFTLSFPVSRPESRRQITKSRPVKGGTPGRILVVEDDDRNRRLFEEALTVCGHQVVGVPDGETALDRFRRDPFDLIVTDLAMPGISGWEVAKGVRSEDPDVRIILVSGWGIQQGTEQIRECGIDRVLSKPCHMKELQQAVADVLRERQKTGRKRGRRR